MGAQLRYRTPGAGQLWDLATGISAVLDRHRSSTVDDWWTVAQLRPALEHALDQLLAVAADLGIDTPDARSALATRDSVESHLRAAADIEAADARPKVVTKVLVDAAELVVIEAKAHRPPEQPAPPQHRP